MSINWGPWAEIGLAARPDRGGAMATHGINSIAAADGITALDRLMRSDAVQACVLPVDRVALRRAAGTGLLPGLLETLVGDGPVTTAHPTASDAVRTALLAVEPGRRRRALLVRHCVEEVAAVLRLDPDRVDTAVPLASLGFDSLLSLELRRRLELSLSIALPATVAWQFPTIDALVPHLADRMGVELTASRPEPDAAPAGPDGAELVTDLEGTDLEQMPDQAVEALLLAKMAQLDEGLTR